jgi:hypothetical protein
MRALPAHPVASIERPKGADAAVEPSAEAGRQAARTGAKPPRNPVRKPRRHLEARRKRLSGCSQARANRRAVARAPPGPVPDCLVPSTSAFRLRHRAQRSVFITVQPYRKLGGMSARALGGSARFQAKTVLIRTSIIWQQSVTCTRPLAHWVPEDVREATHAYRGALRARPEARV